MRIVSLFGSNNLFFSSPERCLKWKVGIIRETSALDEDVGEGARLLSDNLIVLHAGRFNASRSYQSLAVYKYGSTCGKEKDKKKAERWSVGEIREPFWKTTEKIPARVMETGLRKRKYSVMTAINSNEGFRGWELRKHRLYSRRRLSPWLLRGLISLVFPFDITLAAGELSLHHPAVALIHFGRHPLCAEKTDRTTLFTLRRDDLPN